jgi:hypothetical protein
MAVPPERPQPFQPAPQQLQHVLLGVDVPVPEVCLASTVDTAQDVSGELEYDLHARELGRHQTTTQRYHRARGSAHRLVKHVMYLSSRRPVQIPGAFVQCAEQIGFSLVE